MSPEEPRATTLDAVRAVGVMLGGPAVLAAAAAWGVGATVRALAGGRRPSAPAVASVAGLAAYVLVARPWLRNWGATPAERGRSLPGDELVERPGSQTTRAVTVNAPVEEVWPWLAQIGQDRGGFYSYEWLENLAGCRLRNVDRIHPEWQHRDVGETVPLHWAHGLTLARFDAGRALAFEGGWYFVLEPQDGSTRLIARGRVPKGLGSAAYAALLELPHFVMERKMLLGIRDRVERLEKPPVSAAGR
jgi:hypothetical protein